MEKCYYRISIKALILDEQKRFLLALEEPGGAFGLQWGMPGGGLDHGEIPHEGLRREVLEEMGLLLTHIDPRPSYFYPAVNLRGNQVVDVVYRAEVEHLNFVPSSECREIRFFTVEEALKEKLLPTVQEFRKHFRVEDFI